MTTGPTAVEIEVAERIRRHGPRPFDEIMDLALYDPDHGFYAIGGSAGRRGDFITSVEVGPLFGAVIAGALDTWWDGLGEPDPFYVIEAGAGVGLLARTIRAAQPRCLAALTYLLVEQSAVLRDRHGDHLELTDPAQAVPPGADPDTGEGPAIGRGPRFVSRSSLPAPVGPGIVLANELLDNLPIRLVERRADGWDEVHIGLAEDDRTLVEFVVPADERLAAAAEVAAPGAAPGARLPVQLAAADWLRDALGVIDRGRVVLIDYGDRSPSLAARPMDEWLRTYRAHERGTGPLSALGTQDVTCEVAIDQLERVRPATAVKRQAEWLRAYGIDELVDEGRRIWTERAAIGDLAAIKARSRINEAAALTDPTGLGAFWVLEWTIPSVP